MLVAEAETVRIDVVDEPARVVDSDAEGDCVGVVLLEDDKLAVLPP